MKTEEFFEVSEVKRKVIDGVEYEYRTINLFGLIMVIPNRPFKVILMETDGFIFKWSIAPKNKWKWKEGNIIRRVPFLFPRDISIEFDNAELFQSYNSIEPFRYKNNNEDEQAISNNFFKLLKYAESYHIEPDFGCVTVYGNYLEDNGDKMFEDIIVYKLYTNIPSKYTADSKSQPITVGFESEYSYRMYRSREYAMFLVERAWDIVKDRSKSKKIYNVFKCTIGKKWLKKIEEVDGKSFSDDRIQRFTQKSLKYVQTITTIKIPKSTSDKTPDLRFSNFIKEALGEYILPGHFSSIKFYFTLNV